MASPRPVARSVLETIGLGVRIQAQVHRVPGVQVLAQEQRLPATRAQRPPAGRQIDPEPIHQPAPDELVLAVVAPLLAASASGVDHTCMDSAVGSDRADLAAARLGAGLTGARAHS